MAQVYPSLHTGPFFIVAIGNVIGTATFTPRPGTGEQRVNVTVNYPDDRVALEPDEIYRYMLGSVRGDARIGSPDSATHRLVDDDGKERKDELHQDLIFFLYLELTIRFVQPAYTFNEPDGSVFVEVNISNPIARSFSINSARGQYLFMAYFM